MQIRSADGGSVVEVAKVADQPDGLPSVALSISITGNGFAGRSHSVWVHDSALRAFAGALKALDQTRAGDALLEGLSPGEFALQASFLDGAGHLAGMCSLSTPFYLHDKLFRNVVSLSFSLDPSSLPGIAAALEALCLPTAAR